MTRRVGDESPSGPAHGPDPGPGPRPDAPPRGFDRVSAAMATVTAVALASTLWLKLGPAPANEPPGVGATAPALRLIDASTAKPVVLIGLRGRLVWLAFWSGRSPTARSDLAGLGVVWDRLKGHPRFAMVAAAVDADDPAGARRVVDATGARLPFYLATPEMCRAYGAEASRLPMHVLIDEDGRVGAVARGRGTETLERLARQAEDRLERLEPMGNTRFASVLA